MDSNIQRENTPISEKAKAIKMKYKAIKRQGARTDLTSPKISAKLRSDDEIGRQMGMSGDSVRNYMALTELVPELMQMVDDKKIALTPAYQIAVLTQDEQRLLLDTIDSEQATPPSLSQAQRMKKLSQSGELYEIYHRASCRCCPFQWIDKLRKLRKYHPTLWQKLMELDRRALAQFGSSPLGQFKQNWSVERLERWFSIEDTKTAA